MGAEKRPAMPHYVKDWRGSSRVRCMTLEAKGGFHELLDSQWLDGSIPSDMTELAAICGVTVSKMRLLWRTLGPCFTPMPSRPERLVNPKLEEVRAELDAFKMTKSAAGKLGALARWGMAPACGVNAMPLAEGMANTLPASASASASNNKDTPAPPANAGSPAAAGGEAQGPVEVSNGRKAKRAPWEPKHPETQQTATYLARAVAHFKPDSLALATIEKSTASLKGIDGLLLKRASVDVRAVIDWLFGGERGDYAPTPKFDWRPNIASGASLAEKFDRLETEYRFAQEPDRR